MSTTIDNRNLDEICYVQECRIEALTRHIAALEHSGAQLLAEKAALQAKYDALVIYAEELLNRQWEQEEVQ